MNGPLDEGAIPSWTFCVALFIKANTAPIPAIIPKAALLLKIETGTAVAALTKLSATTLGLGAIAAVAGVGLAVSAFKAMQNVNDGIAPSSKGPFTITDSYGATAVTAKGDSLAVSPNIRREERNPSNASSVAIDYDKLADAIAMGAERGTAKAKLNVNLDGNAVANNLQTPMAMGARKYSV